MDIPVYDADTMEAVVAPATRRLLDTIHEVTRRLSGTIDPTEGLREVLRIAAEAVGAAAGSIWQHNRAEKTLVCRHAFGERSGEMIGFSLRDDEGIAGAVFQSAVPRRDGDVSGAMQHARRVDENVRFRTQSLITLPLRYPGGVPVGVMQLVNKHGPSGDSTHEFNEEDGLLLESIADVAAMSLHVSELARAAARTAALDYVGYFAHDVYNRLVSSYTGLPTFRDGILRMASDWDERYPELGATSELKTLSTAFLDPVADDAALIYRYMRFIARLTKPGAPIEAEFREQDVIAVARAQVASLRLTAREYNVTLNGPVSDSSQPILAPIDEILLGSAIYNLINNALPETVGGSVAVSVRAVRAAGKPGGFCEIEVSDTGRGMPQAVLASILAGQPISLRESGTGLGTLIVKRVTERHGGTLHGESALGVGTSFTMAIPLTSNLPAFS